MAIRIRWVNGICVALCAVETDAENGDVYIDDAQHYALAAKFAQDYQGESLPEYPEIWAVMDSQRKRDAKVEIERWIRENE